MLLRCDVWGRGGLEKVVVSCGHCLLLSSLSSTWHHRVVFKGPLSSKRRRYTVHLYNLPHTVQYINTVGSTSANVWRPGPADRSQQLLSGHHEYSSCLPNVTELSRNNNGAWSLQTSGHELRQANECSCLGLISLDDKCFDRHDSPRLQSTNCTVRRRHFFLCEATCGFYYSIWNWLNIRRISFVQY